MEQTLDLNALPAEELVELYLNLQMRYKELTTLSESDAQKIYELKRSLDTATAAQAFLAQELEQLTGVGSEPETSKKVQHELEELRRKNAMVQQEYDELLDERIELQREIKDLREAQHKYVPEPPTSALCDETEEELTQLKQEFMTLLHKLEDARENTVKYTMTIADREKNLEILRDQVCCLEENLRFKREELEETTQLLECAQEQLAEANARIAMLTSAPEKDDRKGNSLFAEVDDQRQAMKQLLAAQKKSYLQMKKSFNESEYEIRRLKRENRAMHTELKACTSIFITADKTYRDKLKERVGTLVKQNEELERKVKWTQDRLSELADQKGAFGVNSLFKMCKQETDELKTQLHSVRIQKAALEEQLRSTQQDMARWRFESLRLRCVLLDREGLLNEHKIAFKAQHIFKVDLSDAQQRVAEPIIFAEAQSSTKIKVESSVESSNEKIANMQSIEAHKAAEPTICSGTQSSTKIKLERPTESPMEGFIETEANAPSNDAQELKPQLECAPPVLLASIDVTQRSVSIEENKENIQLAQHSPIISLKEKEESKVYLEREATTLAAHTPLKNAHGNSLSNPTQTQPKKSPPPSSQLPGPSILCKKRDVFPNDAQKNVQFNQQPAVFFVTPHKSSADGSLPARPKIVIRRVHVQSKTTNH